MSWYTYADKSSIGYYTTINKYTNFSNGSTGNVYDGLSGLKSGWSNSNKNKYVYVPFNSSNYQNGDYKASSTLGMRKGFDWIEFESPGFTWYYAPNGNRDRNNSDTCHRGNDTNSKVKASSCQNTNFWRAPLYFRTYWMNSLARKTYGWNTPKAGAKYPNSSISPPICTNKQDIYGPDCTRSDWYWSDSNPQLTSPQGADQTSWDHAYQMNNDDIVYPCCDNDNKAWTVNAHGLKDGWLNKGCTDCYDNRTSEYLGSVPHLRNPNNVLKNWSKPSYISSVYINSIDDIYANASKPWLTGKTPSTSPSYSLTSPNAILNKDTNLSHLKDTESLKIPTSSELLQKSSTPASFSFTATDYKLPTLSVPTYTANVQSSTIFNAESDSNRSTNNSLIQNSNIYLAVPRESGCYPNYFETINVSEPFTNLMKDLMSMEGNYMANGNPISTSTISGTDSYINNFKLITGSSINNYKNYILNRYNYMCDTILNGGNGQSILSDMLYNSSKQLDMFLWKTGFIFKLVDLILQTKNKSINDIIPYIDAKTEFFINETNASNNSVSYSINNTDLFNFYRVTKQSGFRNFGINTTPTPTKSSSTSNYSFLQSSIKTYNANAVTKELADGTKISSQTTLNTSTSKSNSVNVSDTITISFRCDDTSYFTENKYWYLNGFKANITSNPCCCHTTNTKTLYVDEDNIGTYGFAPHLGEACTFGNRTWTQAIMIKIPWWVYKVKSSAIKSYFQGYADKQKANTVTYTIEPSISNITITNVGVVYNGSSGTDKEFTFNKNTTQSNIAINTVHQQDREVSQGCYSQYGVYFHRDNGDHPKVTNPSTDINVRDIRRSEENSTKNAVKQMQPNRGYTPSTSLSSIVLPDDQLVSTDKTVGDFLSGFGIANVNSSDDQEYGIVKCTATINYKISYVSSSGVNALKTASLGNSLAPLTVNKRLYVITKSFMDKCYEIIANNVSIIYNNIRNIVLANKSCKALNFMFKNINTFSDGKDVAFYNIPIGPFLMQNNESYLLNYHGFTSKFGFRTISDGITINITDPIMDKLVKTSSDKYPNPDTSKFTQQDLVGNYLDLFMSDLVAQSKQTSINDTYFVIEVPQLENILKITSSKYDLLGSKEVVHHYLSTTEILKNHSDDLCLILSPKEITTSTEKASKLFNATPIKINMPSVIIQHGNIARTIRIGNPTWYMYIHGDLMRNSSPLNNGTLYDLSYKINTTSLPTNYQFMAGKSFDLLK